jgi:hypothetical protein
VRHGGGRTSSLRGRAIAFLRGLVFLLRGLVFLLRGLVFLLRGLVFLLLGLVFLLRGELACGYVARAVKLAACRGGRRQVCLPLAPLAVRSASASAAAALCSAAGVLQVQR